jgi:deoxyribonuclease-4
MTDTAQPTRIRVRTLLSALNSVERTALKKLLPRGVATAAPSDPEGTRYPAALLSNLPKEESYSLLGHIAEAMLRFTPAEITLETLLTTVQTWAPTTTETQCAKIAKSPTTEPFLAHLRETRKKLRFVARGEFAYDQVVASERVEGHPDIRTPTQIFEVKLSGLVAKNWIDFCFQTFAYAALAPEATDLYIVLPLQETVWHHDVRGWTQRAAYREFLEAAAIKKDMTTQGSTGAAALALIQQHHIGTHMSKLKTLAATAQAIPAGFPTQIFLAGPQSSRITAAEADIAACHATLQATGDRMFVHSAYLINLCTPESADNEGYHTRLLRSTLQISAAAGARGVVVHVGKSVKQPVPDALATMRTNLIAALDDATPACPILLETPAGQGTEVLRSWEEFVGFVAAIGDPRLRICVDTCHVFACGHNPLTYIQRLLADHPALIRLIHFNDSATPCGSCLDRHAFCGQGEIGLETMTAIAETATAAGLPMVIE